VSDSIVIIPTYNEKENIEKMVRKVLSLPKEFHILIVDDGSPDGTAEIVKNLMKEFPGKLFLEERKGKLGLGTAYIHGFKWSFSRQYEFVYEMDADFSHNPDDLLRLYDACINGGADVGMGVRDTTSGFKCYRKKVLQAIELDNIKFIGYAFQIEMKFKALKKGFKIKEVPITFIDRQQGTSKMSSNIFTEAVLGVLKMRFSS
jgi:dolichol-phosphate mannosyltransferase